MLNNILKVGVGILCIYFMRMDNNLIVDAEEPTVAVFSQSNVVSKYKALFDDLKLTGAISSESKLLSVNVYEEEIVLNVNKSFIYIGGTYKEREIINKFILIGLSEPNIKYVTILVDGKVSETSEGINIYKLNKLFELD